MNACGLFVTPLAFPRARLRTGFSIPLSSHEFDPHDPVCFCCRLTVACWIAGALDKSCTLRQNCFVSARCTLPHAVSQGGAGQRGNGSRHRCEALPRTEATMHTAIRGNYTYSYDALHKGLQSCHLCSPLPFAQARARSNAQTLRCVHGPVRRGPRASSPSAAPRLSLKQAPCTPFSFSFPPHHPSHHPVTPPAVPNRGSRRSEPAGRAQHAQQLGVGLELADDPHARRSLNHNGHREAQHRGAAAGGGRAKRGGRG